MLVFEGNSQLLREIFATEYSLNAHEGFCAERLWKHERLTNHFDVLFLSRIIQKPRAMKGF